MMKLGRRVMLLRYSTCKDEILLLVIQQLLSCQSIVTVTSWFAYKVIKDLESIDDLCINPIRSTQLFYGFALAQVECTS